MAGGLTQMIQLINSKELIIELFDAYAPSLKVQDLDLGKRQQERAVILYDRLDEFVNVSPAEHGALFRALNTIAAVNNDNSNYKAILEYLDGHPALKRSYESLHYAGIFKKRHPLAQMAAFVAIRARVSEGEEREDARSLWNSLRVSASKTEQGNFLHKNITAPSHTPAQMAKGLETFQEELQKYVRRSNQHKDYLAFVIPNRTSEGYISYYVNTSPPERDVLKIEEGRPVLGIDNNMVGFEIRYFYARDKVWISETKAGDQSYVLDLFLKYVLGAQIERQKRRHCEHRLPVFKTAERFAQEITLTEESVKSGERVWISELEIQVYDRVDGDNFELKHAGEDVYLPIVFTGNELNPIHDQIARQLQSRFPSNQWKVLRVELTAKLHPSAYDAFDDSCEAVGETTDFAKVTYTIRPGGCSPRVENKYKDDRELQLKAKQLRSRWGLDGLSDERFFLLPQKERDGEI